MSFATTTAFSTGRRRWALRGALAGIVALALYVRLQAIVTQGGDEDYVAWALKHYFGGISPGYLKLAEHMLAGDYASYVPTSFAYPPGYPALLAAFLLAGIDDLQVMRAVQAVIDCAGVPLAFFLLRRATASLATALCGAVLYAVYPLIAFGSIFLLAEFMSPVLVLGALALVVLCGDRERPSLAIAVGTGIYLGLAALVRPDLLLLPGLLAAWLVWRHASRPGVVAAAVLVATFAIPVSSWGLYNRLHHGHWIFSTTGGGNALWEGLGMLPNEYGYVLNDVKAGAILREKGMSWLSVEADRYFKSEYLRAWREHPEYVLRVIAWRWRLVLTDSETWLPEARSTFALKRMFDRWGGVILVLAAAVAFRRSPVRVLLVAVPVIYALGSIGMTHWEARYVRYIHVSYLFALLLLLDLVAARAGGVSALARRSVLAVPCVATAWAAGDVLASIRFEAEGGRALAAAKASMAASPFAGDRGLCSTTFENAVTQARLSRHGCNLDLVTSRDPFAYQAIAKLRIPERSAVIARYSGRLEAGGVSLGILSGDGARFLDQATVGQPGRFEGQLAGYSGRLDSVQFVVSNFSASGESSRVTLDQLEIRCHPVACGGGTTDSPQGQNAKSTAPQGARPEKK